MFSTTLLSKFEQLTFDKQKQVEAYMDKLLKSSEKKQIVNKPARFGDIKPGFGGAKGLFGEISDDFDEPLDCMKDYML